MSDMTPSQRHNALSAAVALLVMDTEGPSYRTTMDEPFETYRASLRKMLKDFPDIEKWYYESSMFAKVNMLGHGPSARYFLLER